MSSPSDTSRRNFLRTTLTAGVGLAAAITSTGAAAVKPAEQPEENASKQGYRLTQHILDYYKRASL